MHVHVQVEAVYNTYHITNQDITYLHSDKFEDLSIGYRGPYSGSVIVIGLNLEKTAVIRKCVDWNSKNSVPLLPM